MRARRLVTVALLIVVIVAVPPALIGLELRALLSPWLAKPVTMFGAGVLRARLTENSWFSTRVSIALENGPTSGAGALSFEHSPATWTSGIKTTTASYWPGYVVGQGHLEIDDALLGGLFTPKPGPARITAEVSAGASAHVNATLHIPAGSLRLEEARITLTQATLTLATNLLEPEQPMPFTAQLDTPDGMLDANGALDPATGRWQLEAQLARPLVHQVMTSLLLAELSANGHRLPDPNALAKLSARRVRALITLGYLQERNGKLFTEAALGENGFEVFGEPVALSLPTANLNTQRP